MKDAIPKRPNFREIEERWQKYWDDNGINRFNLHSGKPVYSIDTPPPTISGDLHVGHAFSYNQAEFIARQRRMRGFEVFYPMGFDDNGLPTERYVEKVHGVRSQNMERGKFIELCLQETAKAREKYKEVWRRLGISVDWDYLYSTIDKISRRISQKSFLELYKGGRIYRKEDAIIWCTTCETGISQADVDTIERNSSLNFVYFTLPRGERLTIATSRPELLPACQAIFVHPADQRYARLIGTTAEVPLVNMSVKIMSDENVNPDFGTGAVMMCTFGDNTDIEWWRSYNLPFRIVIDKNGHLTENAGDYRGLRIDEARREIIKELDGRKLLYKQEPISHHIGVHERCETPVEYLVSKQWFVKLLDLKDQFIEEGEKVNWVPSTMRNRYVQEVKNLRWDWNISRQRHFGVPFPVWYCNSCDEVQIPDESRLPIDPFSDKPGGPCGCGSQNFSPEPDVMDTWMTSSLTPLINGRWGEPNSLMDMIYPMDLRPQAHDIIRTWAFYTIVKGLYHTKSVPWRHAMISSYVLDKTGRGMSKHLGNTVSPIDMADKYSADALRLWAADKPLGRNVPFREEEVVESSNFLTKLWNAARLISPHLEDYQKCTERLNLRIPDRWIKARINRLVRGVSGYFDEYEYFRASSDIRDFFWGVFCDFYLEMVKYRLHGTDIDSKIAAKGTLYDVFFDELRLLAPFIPHTTEELYQNIYREKEIEKSIHLARWPEYSPSMDDSEALQLGDIAMEVISDIRKWKTERRLGMGREVDEMTVFHPNGAELQPIRDDIAGTLRIKNMKIEEGESRIIIP